MAVRRYKYLRPEEIRSLSNKELRAEYSRARAAANKRIQRMFAAGLSDNVALFPKIKGLTDSEIESALAAASKVLRSERYTVTGTRKAMRVEMRIFRERGYTFLNESNFKQFTDFMESWREEAGDKIYDSFDAVDVFDQGQRLNIPPDVLQKHFDYFVENMDKLEQITPIKTDRAIKYSDIKRKINRL